MEAPIRTASETRNEATAVIGVHRRYALAVSVCECEFIEDIIAEDVAAVSI
jgi:hypothetical protein